MARSLCTDRNLAGSCAAAGGALRGRPASSGSPSRASLPVASLLVASLLPVVPAWAQAPAAQAQVGAPTPLTPAPVPTVPPAPGPALSPGEEGADQLVGLFAATCLHYPGNAAALRGFLSAQGAPPMPPQARDAFLAGRAGQVFDTSYNNVRLALISLDDGSCEAVADRATGTDVIDFLGEAMRDARLDPRPQGDFTDPRRPAVHQNVWLAQLAGRPWLVTAVTAPQPPQAALGLHPQPAGGPPPTAR